MATRATSRNATRRSTNQSTSTKKMNAFTPATQKAKPFTQKAVNKAKPLTQVDSVSRAQRQTNTRTTVATRKKKSK